MDLPDSLQPGSVHGILMAAVLQIVIVADVLHHLVMRHKVVVLSVLLVLLRRPSRVWAQMERDEKYSALKIAELIDATESACGFACLCVAKDWTWNYIIAFLDPLHQSCSGLFNSKRKPWTRVVLGNFCVFILLASALMSSVWRT